MASGFNTRVSSNCNSRGRKDPLTPGAGPGAPLFRVDYGGS